LDDNARYDLANQVNQAFVDTVRATGGNNANRFLLIPGYGTNIEQTCDMRFRMPSDTANDKLLISVHCYSPWSYCGASSAATATKWGTKSNFESLEAEIRMMTKFTSQGIGVVIGEYGALPGADGLMKDNAVTYHRYFLDLCDYYDLCSCLWDTSGFFVREKLAFSDADMAALYSQKRRANEADADAVKAAARASIEAAVNAAPESFREDAIELSDDTIVAWIMWSSGDWSVSYSVGDTYDPDSISQGLVPTDAVITGEGTYTVALDFTGTANGASSNVAFAAIGLSNAEIINPGWAVHISEMKINGQPYTMKGRPYTTSDDGKCTRVNIYNEWVTKLPEDARVLYGPNISISATPIDRNDPVFSEIRTIEITFVYGPKK
ncbi:MAG: cellulase family glycosylhydrolase, partial [Clostridia bacterium]|nr:cellulase family glycosylhydrolase [Clostridia bacterium]